jgi:hypothetical protein
VQLLTPQQLRERLVEFYMGAFKRAYGHADRASLERKVVADLEYVDAAKRHAPPPSARSAPPPPRNLASKAASTVGMDVAKPTQPREIYRPNFLHKNPMLISERWGAATARVARILQGSWGSALTDAVNNAEVPRLAKKFLDVYAAYMMRGRPAPTRGVDRNEFRNLSDKDAARLFMRKVEDICDESTRELGGWYIR